MRIAALIILVIFIFSSAGFCQDSDIVVKVTFLGASNPAISRHLGFTAYIPSTSFLRIRKNTIKFFVNGENKTHCLQMEVEPSTGSLYISYKPDKPLPLGRVTQKLIGKTQDDSFFEKRWEFIVNPAADAALASWFRSVRNNPRNENAHFQLAKAYEKKLLLEDAATEYREVLKLAPKHTLAKEAYNRIFALWDRKSLSKGGVTLDVTRDSGLEKLGLIILFRIKIFNNSSDTVKMDPADAIMIIEGESQEEPIKRLKDYPQKILDMGLINIDDFARLKHYLETHDIPLLERKEIQSGISSGDGYLAFGTRGVNYRAVTLVIRLIAGSRKSLEFRFPFLKL